MPHLLGLDIGSRNTKIVIISQVDKQVVYSACSDTGINPVKTVDFLLEEGMHKLGNGMDSIYMTYTTGYGRNLYKSDKVISEISCHAIGVQYEFPQVKTIIDIGGQDSKIIEINDDKKITDFIMNDKCAAGTGRFLEMVAIRLGTSCNDLSKIAADANQELHLSSTCVVFAESEIIGLIAKGYSPSNIARAIHHSIADRIISQANQLNWNNPVVFTGGVALNNDLKKIISLKLGCEVYTPSSPLISGALGAALIALNDYEKN